jgi:hypothetical protein
MRSLHRDNSSTHSPTNGRQDLLQGAPERQRTCSTRGSKIDRHSSRGMSVVEQSPSPDDSTCYKRPSLPPAVRAHSRQNKTPDKTPTGDRLATKATAGALHWWKCQQFWLAHSHIPLERSRAAAFIASLNSGRTLRRRSGPSRTFSRRSFTAVSTSSDGGDSLIQLSCRLNR